MSKTLQIISQIAFLILFIVLVVLNKIQMWMVVFLLSVVATIILSRIYCGWICPINTIIKATNWIKNKLHIKSFKIPKFLEKNWIRYIILALFFATFAFTMISGRKLPVLPIVVAIGVIISLFFPEELWHRYLCPYGTILSLPGSKSMHYLQIDKNKCTSCGLCKKVCPAKAVNKEDKNYDIIKKDCLVCMECERKCPVNAIEYK